MSSKAKQTLKTSILKQGTSESEVMQKIDLLLNRLNTVPETPTNSGESISRIQTRSSKAINAFNQEPSETSDSDQSQSSKQTTLKVSPIMTNSMTRWKGLTKPFTQSYNRMSAPDLALEERELGFPTDAVLSQTLDLSKYTESYQVIYHDEVEYRSHED
ncbi:hypothetical protein PIB30_062035 [Stylosanthes scabra]|uniref:Uncharacterized protein n=1 Tax=Stylosanthes scabra TaxID=79078 RepID=A0ABU6ZJS0_9FABA|nr:hypothetical protein [Stylosanthes scabra]